MHNNQNTKPKKIEKLMGLLAILDLSSKITEDHLRFAIKFTETLDATVMTQLRLNLYIWKSTKNF